MVLSTAQCVNRIITSKPYSAELFIKLVEKYRVTNVLTPPSQIALLIQSPLVAAADLSSIEKYASGGSLVSAYLREHLKRIIPSATVAVAYGS